MSDLAFLKRAKRRAEFEWPGPADRVAIVGKTGSGKTTFAFYLLSEAADFDRKPWIIVDYKGEGLVTQMLRENDCELISLRQALPRHPGLYCVRPDQDENELMTAYLKNVYRQTRIGLLFDELTMVPDFGSSGGNGGALKNLLTQGRSKEIPIYGCTQRPVSINLSMLSEAGYISCFRLKKKSDWDRVTEFTDDNDPLWQHQDYLPNGYSKWYDDKRDVSFKLKPCPPPEHILDTIGERMYKLRKRRAI